MLSVLHSSYARLARLRMNASSWINNASPPLKQVIRWPTVHLRPMGQVCPVCGQFFVFWIIQEELHLCQRPRSVWHQHETVALFAHAPCLHQALWYYSASYREMCPRHPKFFSHGWPREIVSPVLQKEFCWKRMQKLRIDFLRSRACLLSSQCFLKFCFCPVFISR